MDELIMNALNAIKSAKEDLALAQAIMHQTDEFKTVTAALHALYAARYAYCLAYHRAAAQDSATPPESDRQDLAC